MHRVLHRLLAGSAAALTAAAAVALPGSPALAAGPTVRLHFPDTAVAGKTPKVSPLLAWIDVPGKEGEPAAPLAEITIRVDTSGVADVADVEAIDEFEIGADQDCARTGAVLECRLTGIDVEAGTLLLPLLVLQVTAKPGAARDAEGKLAFSARFGDAAAVSSTATISIGEEVDLAGSIGTPRTVAPGATLDTGVGVANVGTTPAKGAVLLLNGWHPSLTSGGGFGNCRYGFVTVCTFDDELAPGTAYELSTPMRLKIPADAAGGSRASAVGSWYTPSDFKELVSSAPDLDDELFGPKGTGAATRLQAVPPKGRPRAAGNQVDNNPKNNFLVSDFVVSGRAPDLAAAGATLKGEPGDEVAAPLGFRNEGPGTLYHWTFDNTDPATHVVVPPGAEAVRIDERCFPLVYDSEPEDFTEDYAGASEYLCMLEDGKTPAGSATLFDFTFKVREDPSGAAGKVLINEEYFGEETPLDRNGRNDSAKITVAFGGGQGGGLPVTGANAGLLGAGGAALLLAGAAGLLLVRRRRLRFTA